MISFACPHCRKSLRVKDESAGKKGKCPACAKIVVFPAASQNLASIASGTDKLSPLPGPRQPRRDGHPLAARPVTVSEEPTLAPGKPPGGDTIGGEGGQGTARHPELTEFLAPAQQPDEIGRLGPYRILAILGHGGMGVVFRAEDSGLQRLVALKAMLPGLAASGTARDRFLREARAAAAVKHDHVVTIHNVGEDRGAPYLAMELLEGEPLDERLRRHPMPQVPEILRIGREVALGLAAAHKRGLIHRDIKPANIWLESETGRAKLLDFGLARAAGGESQLTQQGAIVGTPAYMAPEQASGTSVDGRCDLFSLGCVLYHLATGRQPFRGSDTISTLVAVATESPPPPHEVAPGVPRAMSDLVMRLLAKKAEERPESAQAVAQSLSEIEAQTAQTTAQFADKTSKAQGVRTSGPGTTETIAARWAKRRLPLPWLIGSGLLGLAILATAIVILWPTPHGTVRIESDDPDVEIVFDRGKSTIKGADREAISLRAGEHGVLIRRGDFEFEADKFVLHKGETTTLKLELLQGKLEVMQDGKVVASQAVPLPPKFTNSLGMEFVLVPRGTFLMGGGDGTPGTKEVEISRDFYLGKYEVTQEDWEKVTGSNPSRFSKTGWLKDRVEKFTAEELKGFPVENVSWDDTQLFLKALNEKDKSAGWVYRLPKETEWEYACRGGPIADKSEYGFDFYLDKPTKDLLPDQANFNHENGLKRPCKVGSYAPNRLGLYDMHGNVWEWCNDEERQADGASLRVMRGGSWNVGAALCRAAWSSAVPPSNRDLGLAHGLRLARVPSGIDKIGDTGAARSPFPPLDEAWVKHVQGLPAEAQAREVAEELERRNPGFGGRMDRVIFGAPSPVIENGIVTTLHFYTDAVKDLTPVRALPGLRALACCGSALNKGILTDLSPLRGLPLRNLWCFSNMGLKDFSPVSDVPLEVLTCYNTGISDLSALARMPLVRFNCAGTAVKDLAPLAGKKLRVVWISGCPVSDLTPLQGMPVETLVCDRCPVHDLTPLVGSNLKVLDCKACRIKDLSLLKSLPLERIGLDNLDEADARVLRGIKTLKSINDMPVAEFWKEMEKSKP